MNPVQLLWLIIELSRLAEIIVERSSGGPRPATQFESGSSTDVCYRNLVTKKLTVSQRPTSGREAHPSRMAVSATNLRSVKSDIGWEADIALAVRMITIITRPPLIIGDQTWLILLARNAAAEWRVGSCSTTRRGLAMLYQASGKKGRPISAFGLA